MLRGSQKLLFFFIKFSMKKNFKLKFRHNAMFSGAPFKSILLEFSSIIYATLFCVKEETVLSYQIRGRDRSQRRIFYKRKKSVFSFGLYELAYNM